MYIRLSAPEKEKERVSKGVSRVENFNKESKISLGDEQLSKLKKFIKDKFDEWHKATGNERNRLIELNKILEGELPKTDFPFGEENSSQINIKLPSAQFRAFRTIFRRAVFSTRNLFIAKSLNQNEDATKLANIEAALSWIGHEDTNLVEKLKDTDLPCFRDGLALMHAEWVREVEKGVDFKIYKDVTTFEEDYPDAETAGISDNKYEEIIDLLTEPIVTPEEGKLQAQPKEPEELEELQVEYDIDFIKKDGVDFKIFPLANFVHFPFFVDKISELSLYGFTFTETKQSIEQKIKNEFYNKNAERILSDKESESINNQWQVSQNKIEGISPENKEEIQLAKLVVKVDLNDDKIPEQYRVYYHKDKNEIVRIERYNIRRNVPDIVGFRFVQRDGRLRGVSLLNDVADILLEVNALHRHRSNVRRLTDSPSIIYPESLKEEFDYHTHKPGNPIWISDKALASGAVPRQLNLVNVDQTGTSLDEETLLRKDAELLTGPTQGQSGQIDPSDPRAPGNKTAMLLSQANARTQDLVDEWKRSVPDILDLTVSLYYQNAKSQINFVKNINGKDVNDTIDITDFVSPHIKFALSGNVIALSPELEMNKLTSLATTAINIGLAGQKPELMIEFWNRIVIASRTPGFEKLLQEIPQQQGQGLDLQKLGQGLQPGGQGAGAVPQERQLTQGGG